EQPLPPVAAHLLDQGHERLALLGEAILHSRGHLWIRPPLDDALGLEGPQPQRERARADAFERALELAETGASVGQVTDDQECPLARDDLGRVAHRARLIGAHQKSKPGGISLLARQSRPRRDDTKALLTEVKPGRRPRGAQAQPSLTARWL